MSSSSSDTEVVVVMNGTIFLGRIPYREIKLREQKMGEAKSCRYHEQDVCPYINDPVADDK